MDSTNIFLLKKKILFLNIIIVNSCGNSGAHCGVIAYGNCGQTACGAGLCCTRYG
jgi:hypothetical protein